MKPYHKPHFLFSIVLVCVSFLCSCNDDDSNSNNSTISSPVINGPFAPAPVLEIKSIVEAVGQLSIVSTGNSPNDIIAIKAGQAQTWANLSQKVLDASTGLEHTLFIRVADLNGQEQWMAISLEGRLTGPLFDSISTQLVRDEHILRLEETGGNFVIKHREQIITSQNIPAFLDTLFNERAELYFPQGETPSKSQLPVVLQVTGNVSLGNLVNILSVCQAAGYHNLLLPFPAST